MSKSLEEMVSGEYSDAAFLSDIHIPYHDEASVQSVMNFIKHKKPSEIILGGDIMDCYTISRYDKDPSRQFSIQDELDKTFKFINTVIKSSPNSKITYIEGNHEARLIKYLHKHPELYHLRELRIDRLLNLGTKGIKYVKDYTLNSFLFKHGDFAPKYSANKELDVEGTSGMSGHVHRIQEVTKTDRSGEHTWYSNGHLSDINHCDYISGAINWQQGFGYVTFRGRKKFNAQIIHICDHEFMYDNWLYTPEGKVRLDKK